MRSFFTFILIFFSTFQLFSQEISVASFEKRDHDLDARVNHPVKDQNGDVCALIKIETTQTGFAFDGGQLGIARTEHKVGEYWVYVPWGSKRITISHQHLGTLRDYVFPISIDRATVYLMKLTTGKVTTIIEEPEVLTQWVVITSEPSGADVYVNDKPVGKTPFSREYNIGKHQYRLEMPMYHTDAGIFHLNQNTDKEIVNVVLRPNFGTILVNSSPETDADILIDGRPTNKKTPFEFNKVSSGTHTITVKKAMFYDAWQEVLVEDNKQISINLSMNPAYGEINITTKPTADIYIDGSKIGNGNLNIRKTSGFHTLEARKEKHTSDIKKVEVIDGQTINLDLSPKPQYGILKVSSNPPFADIYIDDVKKGSTPTTIRDLLVGEYNLELKLKNHITHSETITITHNQTTETNQNLETGKQITINSSPFGADLEINGKPVGKTPYTNTLAFGEYKIKLKNDNKTITEKIVVTETGETKWSFKMPENRKTYVESSPKTKKVEKKKLADLGSGYGFCLIPGQDILNNGVYFSLAVYLGNRNRMGINFYGLNNRLNTNSNAQVNMYSLAFSYEGIVLETSKFNINLGAGIGYYEFLIKQAALDYDKSFLGLNPSIGIEQKISDHISMGLNYKPIFLFGEKLYRDDLVLGHFASFVFLLNL
ncbi:MAG: PEGA domain-containing protein [Bacteroidales bacterium]|nr:PEGA domain-containing protein [Bacteroidales bacterium]